MRSGNAITGTPRVKRKINLERKESNKRKINFSRQLRDDFLIIVLLELQVLFQVFCKSLIL
mgnify:CR=1 FL=1